MSATISQPLAPVGTTGNNSGTPVGLNPTGDKVSVDFLVEVAGATPTVSYKVQGTFVDAPGVNDWFDLILLPSDSDTPAVSKTVTAVGRTVSFLAQTRFAKQVRLVTSANTNVTYSARLWQRLRA